VSKSGTTADIGVVRGRAVMNDDCINTMLMQRCKEVGELHMGDSLGITGSEREKLRELSQRMRQKYPRLRVQSWTVFFQ